MERRQEIQAAEAGGRLLIAEGDARARSKLKRGLSGDCEVVLCADGAAAWEAAQAELVDAALINRRLDKLKGPALCELLRAQRGGDHRALALMSPSYVDETLAARERRAFDVDVTLSTSAPVEQIKAVLGEARAARAPLAALGVRPEAVAKRIDHLYRRMDSLDYYALLDATPETPRAQLQSLFRKRARLLHPDRHHGLKARHPHAYARITAVYRRLSEAYAVLVDVEKARAYNLGLQKRGSLRLEDSRSPREQRELALCRTAESRPLVLESLELRGLGDLEGAAEAMARAHALEPHNEGFAQIRLSLDKLARIIRSQYTR